MVNIPIKRKVKVLQNHIQKKFDKHRAKECFHITCKNEPIFSHSISRNKLQSIANEKNHVYFPYQDREQGINEASCFYGFCKEHDNDIFSLIDDKPYIENMEKQNFLFYYRALSKQLSNKLINFNIINNLYNATSNDKLGEFHNILKSEKITDDLKVKLKSHFSENLERVEEELFYLEDHFSEKNQELDNAIHNNIITISFEWDDYTPIYVTDTIMFCKCNNMFTLATITIFPQSNKTHTIISWDKKYNGNYDFLYGLKNYGTINEQKEFISKLVAVYVENIFIKHTYWDSLDTNTQNLYRQLKLTLDDTSCMFDSNVVINIFK